MMPIMERVELTQISGYQQESRIGMKFHYKLCDFG